MSETLLTRRGELLQRLQKLQLEYTKIIDELITIEQQEILHPSTMGEENQIQLCHSSQSDIIYLDDVVDKATITPSVEEQHQQWRNSRIYIGQRDNKAYYLIPGHLIDGSQWCAQIVNDHYDSMTEYEKEHVRLLVKSCKEYQHSDQAPIALRSAHRCRNHQQLTLDDYTKMFTDKVFLRINNLDPDAPTYTHEFFWWLLHQRCLNAKDYLGFCFYEITIE